MRMRHSKATLVFKLRSGQVTLFLRSSKCSASKRLLPFMSSFSSLRSERKSKESKSFVSGSMSAAASADEQSSKETPEISTELIKKTAELQPVPLYATLPTNLEIRTSSADGRGIWARETLSAGPWPMLYFTGRAER